MRYRLTFIAGVALGYVLGTRAGRERYEQLKKSARQFAQNPAVRNTCETAAQSGREFAGEGVPRGGREGRRQGAGVRDGPGCGPSGGRGTHNGVEDDWGDHQHLVAPPAASAAPPVRETAGGCGRICVWA